MQQEKLNFPAHSISIILKFESDEERMKAINTPEYSDLFGKLGVFAVNQNRQLISKTSKK
jgi:hypothetical protein